MPNINVIRRVIFGGGMAVAPSPPLSNLVIWLDSNVPSSLFVNSDGTGGTPATGGTVGRWKDISGNNYYVSQTIASQRPLYVTNSINSKPALVFDGIDDILSSPTFTWNRPETIYIVFKRNRDTQIETVFDGFGLNNMRLFMGFRFATEIQLFAQNYGAVTSLSTGSYSIIRCVFKASAQGSSITINNEAPVVDAIGNMNADGSGLTLGSYAGGGTYSLVNICEVIGYNSILTAADNTTIMSYLNTKYAIY